MRYGYQNCTVLGRFEGNIVVVARREVPSITNNNRSRYLIVQSVEILSVNFLLRKEAGVLR